MSVCHFTGEGLRPLGPGAHGREDARCVWLNPQVFAEAEFLEWTVADHLRHTKYIRLRDDKDPRTVVMET